jgi:hypothetical protein
MAFAYGGGVLGGSSPRRAIRPSGLPPYSHMQVTVIAPADINRGALSPEIASPEIASPEIASPEIASPEIARPEMPSLEMASPEIASQEISR